MIEVGMRNAEVGNRNAEVGPAVVPKEQDYAAAKDAEVGRGKIEGEKAKG